MPDHDELDRFTNDFMDVYNVCLDCHKAEQDFYIDADGELIDLCYTCPMQKFAWLKEDDDV